MAAGTSGGLDYDPKSVPIKSAATLLLIADRPKLEVLMLKRNAKTVFAGGMWVFPGGRVDEADHTIGAELVAGGVPPCMPNDDAEGAAAGIAAIRETFEEAGVLLAYGDKSGSIIDTGGSGIEQAFTERLDVARAALNAHQAEAFAELLAAEGLVAALDRIHFVSRWITPPGAPKRFDTSFFLASMPTNQHPQQDNNEATHCSWVTPQQALAEFEAGNMDMMTPTLASLAALADFEYEQEVWDELARRDELWRVHIDVDTRELLMPEAAGYESAVETIEFGWMRMKLGSKVPTPKATGNVRNRLKQR